MSVFIAFIEDQSIVAWSKRSRSLVNARSLGDLHSGGVVLCLHHQVLRLSEFSFHGNTLSSEMLISGCLNSNRFSLAKRLFKVRSSLCRRVGGVHGGRS